MTAPITVAVVGAGASGQLAAIAAAEGGAKVVLLEQLRRPGVKVLATGGGRCNLTNLTAAPAFVAAFGRQGRFMSHALDLLGPEALREFFARLGVPTVVEDDVYVFPATGRAADIQSALARRCDQLGVTLLPAHPVRGLWLENRDSHHFPKDEKMVTVPILRGVEVEGGERVEAGRVVLACGGKSWPELGGTGGGYGLARLAGHTIVEPTPALVPLVTREKWPEKLAGVSLARARVWIDLPRQSKVGLAGGLLLTHHGLSGPAILDLSGTVAVLLQKGPVPIRIELLAGVDVAAWRGRFNEWRTAAGSRSVVSLLREHLPESLCLVLCEQAKVAVSTTAAQLPAGGRDALAGLLGALPFTVTETKGFDVAFVTRGGVKLSEVAPSTLASRLLPGLFFAGELLDLDGPCGGFNLQWAFASGYLAGRSAAKRD